MIFLTIFVFVLMDDFIILKTVYISEMLICLSVISAIPYYIFRKEGQVQRLLLIYNTVLNISLLTTFLWLFWWLLIQNSTIEKSSVAICFVIIISVFCGVMTIVQNLKKERYTPNSKTKIGFTMAGIMIQMVFLYSYIGGAKGYKSFSEVIILGMTFVIPLVSGFMFYAILLNVVQIYTLLRKK